MLDDMYSQDPESAIRSVGSPALVWSIQTTPLTFAYEMFMYDITAHTCSQRHMNKRWYNNLPPDIGPFLTVGIIFVILTTVYITY